MRFDVLWIEIDITQSAHRVCSRLIREMRRIDVTALASCSDCTRANPVTKLDHCNEAVATRSVPLFRVSICAGTKGSE